MTRWCKYAIFLGLLQPACSDSSTDESVTEATEADSTDSDGDATDAAETDESATDAAQTEGEQPDASSAEEEPCGGRGEALDGLEVESEQGLMLRLIAAEPEEQIVGDNAWTFAIEDDGSPVEGLEEVMAVTPFMPDHGHGTAVAVEISEVEAGQYELSPVNLRMPGYWLITIEIDALSEDDEPDVATFGVCVR